MEFIAPMVVNTEIEVEISIDDILSKVKYWGTSLIIHALGGGLSMHMVK